MRDIKFRGKRIDNGKWTYGYLFKIWERCFILWGTTNGIPDMVEVIPETAGQFTGLKDKKGVEIFEGDMVTSNMHKYEIVFSHGCFSFHNKSCVRVNQTADDLWYVNEIGIIVIGNIHEVNK